MLVFFSPAFWGGIGRPPPPPMRSKTLAILSELQKYGTEEIMSNSLKLAT